MDDEGAVEGARVVAARVPRTLEGFYASEYAGVLRVVYALCGSWAVAEEITQDAFVRVLRHWEDVRVMERPEGWARRVACNLATSRLRRVTAEARALARHAGRSDRLTVEADLGEDAERFWRLVRSLPPRQAQVVALHYAEDRSVADVAEVLGLAEGTVKAHLHAARRRLERSLGGREEGR